nr:MAG TPA: hypothetical protein [Caudoviricetes sp.]
MNKRLVGSSMVELIDLVITMGLMCLIVTVFVINENKEK